MATLTPAVPSSRVGLELSADAVPCSAAGDQFTNDGRTLVVFTNAGGAPVTVTFPIPVKVDGRDVAPRILEVPAASVEAFGPFDPGWYNDAEGVAQVTYSSVVDLFVRITRVTP